MNLKEEILKTEREIKDRVNKLACWEEINASETEIDLWNSEVRDLSCKLEGLKQGQLAIEEVIEKITLYFDSCMLNKKVPKKQELLDKIKSEVEGE